mmetsp:Transcript_37166/g.78425  ORF Transcript_37166/g.78425 Transcript_37166/m.78425 type:complete len:157 (-) Transcript_37166:263-733(-)
MVTKIFLSLATFIAQIIVLAGNAPVSAFVPTLTTSPLKSPPAQSFNNNRHHIMTTSSLSSSPEDNNLGVIDLTDDDDDIPAATKESAPVQAEAPFLSQGEISDDPNLLNPDFSDAKQTRVIIYIILTLIPVLFLVPLMIGSRDLIPLDALPPVEMN